MPRPPEAAPALIYQDGDDIYLDGQIFDNGDIHIEDGGKIYAGAEQIAPSDGGGGISGLTEHALPKALTATTIGDSNITDDGSSITINGDLVAIQGDCDLRLEDGSITAANGTILAGSSTEAMGYGPGAWSPVTQGTNRTTAVTIDTPAGAITLISAAGSATPRSFTVNCAACQENDTPVVVQRSGTDLYEIFVTSVVNGSFRVTSFTTGGTTTETPVFNYNIVKGGS